MASPAWPDWTAAPEPEPTPPQPSGARARLLALGPVGIAAIVAAILVLFGIGAVVVPQLTAGGPSGEQQRPPAFAAQPPTGGVPTSDPAATPSEEPSVTESPTPTPSATRPSSVPSTNPQFVAKVVALVNQERGKGRDRCPAVRVNEKLQQAAQAHSADMAAQNYFSHTGKDGSSPFDRMRKAGYNQGMSENIAQGQSTPEQVMQAWIRSDGHRDNIMNCDAKSIGVGLAYRGRTPYWTQVFGRA